MSASVGWARLILLFGPIALALEGRPSLQFVVLTSILLFWLVALLAAYMISFRAYHALRRRWRERRKAFFQTGVEAVLMEEPLDAVLRTLRPRYPGDLDVLQDVLCESMRHLLGSPLDALCAVAHRLGLIERNLRLINARNRHARGRALEALGLMRAQAAVAPLVKAVYEERMDLKLVALRSLALIGEPAVLPHFIIASDRLAPPMLPRLASLMLEFGPQARPRVAELVARHPAAFPPRVMQLVLVQTADSEAP